MPLLCLGPYLLAGWGVAILADDDNPPPWPAAGTVVLWPAFLLVIVLLEVDVILTDRRRR